MFHTHNPSLSDNHSLPVSFKQGYLYGERLDVVEKNE